MNAMNRKRRKDYRILFAIFAKNFALLAILIENPIEVEHKAHQEPQGSRSRELCGFFFVAFVT